MAGAAESSRPPALGRVRSAFAALAAFHQRLSRERWEGASTGLALRYKAASQLVEGGLDVLEQAIERAGELGETERREAAMSWVRLARAVAPRLRDPLHQAAMRIVPLQPCLRDARAEHFLFMGECVTGLIDFGAMDIDCVASDLARLIREWFDGEPAARAEALAAYERVRPLDIAEAALIEPFESATSLLIGEHWIRWHYLEGRHFDDPLAVSHGIARGLGYLEQLARSIGERGLAK
jgi:homoserine kinase type II